MAAENKSACERDSKIQQKILKQNEIEEYLHPEKCTKRSTKIRDTNLRVTIKYRMYGTMIKDGQSWQNYLWKLMEKW